MKRSLLFMSLIGISTYSYAQTNTFPATGNVGIGTNAPSAKLEITSSTGQTNLRAVGIKGYLLIDNVGSGQNYYQANSSHRFQVSGGTEAFTILNNSNVGIGTANPAARLDVAGTVRFGDNSGSIGTLSYGTGYITLGTSSANTNIVVLPTGTGNVGIGTTTPDAKLAVNGSIRAKEIKVETANWPDYVFTKDYALPSLQHTEKQIQETGHLPGIPSAKEIETNGVDLGDMSKKLLQKIEELTLHLIEKDKQLEKQAEEISRLNELYRSIAAKLDRS